MSGKRRGTRDGSGSRTRDEKGEEAVRVDAREDALYGLVELL